MFGRLSGLRALLAKVRAAHIALLFFVILGIYLRAYHLDFPSIGYHNMKENEYLSQALGYLEHGDYLRRRMLISAMDPGPGYFEYYPQVPLISWQIFILWKLFGIKLWLARLGILLFSVATIVVMFELVRRLTKNSYIALVAAFLVAVMPVSVFFGRNIQPESAALFFSVLAVYFFVRWRERYELRELLIASACLGVAGLYKFTFLITALPMVALLPFERLRDRAFKAHVVRQSPYAAALAAGPTIIWIAITAIWLNTKEAVGAGTLPRVALFRIFTADYWATYWPVFSSYLNDNYSWWYVGLTLLGLILALLKWRAPFSRAMLGYSIAIVPYSMILSDYIKAHSYYQLPFLPMVVGLSAYAIYFLGTALRQLSKIKHIEYAALLLVLATLPAINASTDRQFDTIFFGLDAAGEYIRAHSQQNERFLIVGHAQSVGVCFAARRRCDFLPEELELLKFAETYRNVSWIFLHGGNSLALVQQRAELWSYIQQNYGVAQIGLVRVQAGYAPLYFVLRRGGVFDLEEAKSWKPRIVKSYDTTQGKLELLAVEEPR